jgi:hypothetical protein
MTSIGPQTLSQDLTTSAGKFALAQKFTDLLIQQQPFLSLGGSGFTFVMSRFQTKIQDEARRFFNEYGPRYSAILSATESFGALWQAISNDDLDSMRAVGSDATARDTFGAVFQEVAKEAAAIGAELVALQQDLHGLSSRLKEEYTFYHDALDAEAEDLPGELSRDQQEIDDLNQEIYQNIDDIVSGSEKLSTGGSDLITGILTVVDVSEIFEAQDLNETLEKTVEADPSPTFAIGAFQTLEEGSEELTQAQVDLKRNNDALADAYQRLAHTRAAITVARAIGSQSSQFVHALSDFERAGASLVTLWGATDGDGISGAMYQFARQIDTAADADTAVNLLGQVREATPQWQEVGQVLEQIKHKLSGVG